MFSLRHLPVVALSVLSLSNASPTKHWTRSNVLVKRHNTIRGCDGPLPTPEPEHNLNTQADLVEGALADMAVLANKAFGHLDDKGSNSPAFQHYFLPENLDSVKKLYSAVAANNDPTNSPYEFIVDCTPVSQCNDNVYAVTNHRPEDGSGPRVMTICPAFFKQSWANHAGLLPTDPDDEDEIEDWCEPEDSTHKARTKSYRKFVTPGHVLLHEITHLDKVGAFLENDQDNYGGHGTFDYITLNGEDPSKDHPTTDVLWQARMLQVLWVTDGERDDTKDGDNNIVKPIRNAESFAGCGTEAYFMDFCGAVVISPNSGVGPDDDEEDPENKPEWDPPAKGGAYDPSVTATPITGPGPAVTALPPRPPLSPGPKIN